MIGFLSLERGGNAQLIERQRDASHFANPRSFKDCNAIPLPKEPRDWAARIALDC
jgi:hypothetical protein